MHAASILYVGVELLTIRPNDHNLPLGKSEDRKSGGGNCECGDSGRGWALTYLEQIALVFKTGTEAIDRP